MTYNLCYRECQLSHSSIVNNFSIPAVTKSALH